MGGGGGAPAPTVYGQEPIQINPFADFYLPRTPESPKGAGATPSLPFGREELLYGRPAAVRLPGSPTRPGAPGDPVQPWMPRIMPMPVSADPWIWERSGRED